MKIIALAVLCAGAGLLAGCKGDFSDDVRSVLGPREAPRTQVFQADQRATYEAVKAAIKEMDFRFVRGGPAEGKIEALSGISMGDDAGSSRQISMKVRLSPTGDGGTEVEAALTEVIEEDSANRPGVATETPLQDTPLYQVLFKNIQTALAAPLKP